MVRRPMFNSQDPGDDDQSSSNRIKPSITESKIAGIAAPSPNLWGDMLHWQLLAYNTGMEAIGASLKSGADAAKLVQGLMRLNPQTPPLMEQTQQQFDDWLAHFMPHIARTGSSAGGRFYTASKDVLQDVLKNTPEPMRGMIQWQLKHNADMQRLMRSDAMADVLEMIGNALPGHGVLYEKQYNHKFLGEDANGHIVEMKADDIVKLFPKNARENAATHEIFPHIILTSSHAQGETLGDVTSITHGIQAMARNSEGKPLPLLHAGEAPTPGTCQTLIVYACDTERNPYLNAAALLRRINELLRIQKTGTLETEFNHISPGAKRLARLMLKCMAEDPARINTDDWQRSITQSYAQDKTPITLRDDAMVIAHHFQLIGYSKGGNVVTDAMRYLVGELTAKNAQGQPIFTQADRNGHGMGQQEIHNVARSIGVMAIAAIEVELTQLLKDYGIRRDSFNNKHDMISAHNYFTGSRYDRRELIEGSQAHLGHAPDESLGSDVLAGYVHNDPGFARRLKELFAANYGKAAISDVHFDQRAKDGIIRVEAATGTMDPQIERYFPQILRAFKASGFEGVTFTNVKTDPGIFLLSAPGQNFATDKNALGKLQKGFEYLRSHVKGLIISQAIVSEQIKRQGGNDPDVPGVAANGPMDHAQRSSKKIIASR